MCVKCHGFASATLAGPHKHVRLLSLISLQQLAREAGSLPARGLGRRSQAVRCGSRSLASEAPVPEGSAHADCVGHGRVPASLQPRDFPVRQTVGRPPGGEAARWQVSGQNRQVCFPAASTDKHGGTDGVRHHEGGAQPSAVSVIPAVSSCRSALGLPPKKTLISVFPEFHGACRQNPGPLQLAWEKTWTSRPASL